MIPFQSQILSALIGAVLAALCTASFLNTKNDLKDAKVIIASQGVQTEAQKVILNKTEKATVITVDNTAQLQKELLNAKDQIAALHRGINNGTIGMRVNVLARSEDAGVPGSPDSKAIPEVISAELDRETSSALVNITATGDEYARQYNGLYSWCEAQIKNQSSK